MKRVWTSAGILVLLLILSVTSLLWLRAESRDYVMLAQSCSLAYEAEETDDALALCETLTRRWERFHSIAGIFVDGARLDPIRETLSGLRPLIERKDPAAAADLARLRIMLRELYAEEVPVIWHIL